MKFNKFINTFHSQVILIIDKPIISLLSSLASYINTIYYLQLLWLIQFFLPLLFFQSGPSLNEETTLKWIIGCPFSKSKINKISSLSDKNASFDIIEIGPRLYLLN